MSEQALARDEQARKQDEQQSSAAAEGHPGRGKRSAAEWITFGIVLLILAGIVGSLLWYALRPGTDVASFEVQVDQAATEEREDRFYVPLHIRNTGTATAEDVIVRAAIMQGDEAVEEVELTFRFVAGGEEADGVAVFEQDPRGATVEASVTSYLQP